MAPTSPGGSSTSPTRPSRSSPRSGREPPGSASAGSGAGRLTPSALRHLAARHGISPRKSLGQHFLIEPALAERIVELADVGPGSMVLEIGAGLGSLTAALAASGATVVAVELDRALAPALREVIGDQSDRVRIEVQDALRSNWGSVLDGPGPWVVVANLPYNVAVPVVMRILEEEPRVVRFLVMVQREVGERLAAGAGHAQYGAVSLRVAYRARARVVRRVPPSVFWPRPKVESVLVEISRVPPPVAVDQRALWKVIEVAFGQRRKTMRGALVRLGLDAASVASALGACGVRPEARPEELGLEAFACLAERWLAASGGGAGGP